MSSLTETLSAKDSIFAQPDTQGLLLILRTTDKLCAAQNVPSGSKAKVLKFKDFGAGKMHMDASEYVLQCLRDTVEESITYTRGACNANELWGWVNADWADDTDIGRPYTSYIVMMNGRTISWKSCRQDNVSLSTSEAEFVAASQAGQQVIYLHETLRNFGHQQTKPTEIYEDNLTCVAMSENQVRRKFSRHIDIREGWVLSYSSPFVCTKWWPTLSLRVCLGPFASATAAS